MKHEKNIKEEDKFKTLMISLPVELNEAIRDLAEGTPKENYNRVLSQISAFVPVCGGVNCRYRIRLFGQNTFFYPTLHRQTHAICDVDNCGRNVSDYSHRVCYKHANIYHPVEYACHHSNCRRNY